MQPATQQRRRPRVSPYDVGAYPHTLVSAKKLTAGQPFKIDFFDGQDEELNAGETYRKNGTNPWQTGIGGAVQMVVDVLGADGGMFVATGGTNYLDRFNDLCRSLNRANIRLVKDTSTILDWSHGVDLTGPMPWIFLPQKVEDNAGASTDVAASVMPLCVTPSAAIAGSASNVAYPYSFVFRPEWQNSDQSLFLTLEAANWTIPASLDDHIIRLRLRGMDHAGQRTKT